MSDFDHYGASGEEDVEIKTIQAEVVRPPPGPPSPQHYAIHMRHIADHPRLQELDPDNFETWEKLIRACEGQEGGLNRNSSPQALASMRSAYDGFLAKFPLLFGYWKKYADLEFNIAGPESAELVRDALISSPPP
jgi:pre-mRNA-processing factor 39